MRTHPLNSQPGVDPKRPVYTPIASVIGCQEAAVGPTHHRSRKPDHKIPRDRFPPRIRDEDERERSLGVENVVFFRRSRVRLEYRLGEHAEVELCEGVGSDSVGGHDCADVGKTGDEASVGNVVCAIRVGASLDEIRA